MRQTMELGPCPAQEDPVQVGDPDYQSAAYEECRRWKAQLFRFFGPSPVGAKLIIKRFPHEQDFYYEVVAVFDDTDEDLVNWAYRLEREAPATWDSEAQPTPIEEDDSNAWA